MGDSGGFVRVSRYTIILADNVTEDLDEFTGKATFLCFHSRAGLRQASPRSFRALEMFRKFDDKKIICLRSLRAKALRPPLAIPIK